MATPHQNNAAGISGSLKIANFNISISTAAAARYTQNGAKGARR
jgi:hypothetical protein